MTLPVTQRTDTLDTWRQNLNTIGSNTGDPVNIYVSDGTDSYTQPATGIIVATLNDLNTRKVKRSGDTISYLNVSTTLHVSGTTTLASLSTTSIAASSSISGASLSVTGQITSTVATGTAPFVVSSTTPVANLSIGGNAATATTATNVSGGTVNATTGSFSGTVTCSNATASGQAVTLGQAEYVYTTATTPLPGTNTAISVAHGLSAIPTDVSLELTCLTADNGYAVGDVLEFGGFGVWTGSSGIDPIPLWKSATNVGFTVPNTLVIVASNKGGGAAASLTLANWSYRFKMKTI